MSSNPLSRFTRSLAFRLSLAYAAVFTMGAAILFGLLYYLLASTLERKDHDVVEARLRQCEAIYDGGGVAALRARVENASEAAREKPFFIRLTGPQGPQDSALIPNVPEGWLQFDVSAVQRGASVAEIFWVEVPRDEERDFTVGSMLLEDGTLLSVGLSTSNSELFLEPFRHEFLRVMVTTLVLGSLAGIFISWRATRPLRQIAFAARTIIDTGDLSERVRVQEGQGELVDLAAQFNRMLERNQSLIKTMRESLDNVAHDLRTPLTRLRMTAETGLQTAVDPAARDALADCVEESDRVLTMVRTLMDIAEAEAGMMKLDLKRTSLASTLSSVVELYDIVAEDKGIKVVTDFAGPCETRADEGRLRQAFANLLDNAIKYSPENSVVKLTSRSQSGGVIVSIEDQGAGIPPGEQERIWERLYRGDKSRSQRGLGLGLSLVKAIVEAHKGQVSVRSEVGKGAAFIVRLPSN